MLILLAAMVLQQKPAVAPTGSVARAAGVVTAVRVERGPVIDGRLDDAVWARAIPVGGFRQQSPNDGEAATESTTVRVLYDRDAIYVGARMWDDHPDQIPHQLSRRDVPATADGFWVDFDSYHDHRTAFEFGVTAAGVKQDDITSNDQLDIDYIWDPVWDVAVRRDSLGWTAEMRIPLSQLRFSRDAEQLWGINFFRQLVRSSEFSMYSHVGATESGYASHFAHLVGIHDLSTTSRMEVVPYVSADARPRDPALNAGRLGVMRTTQKAGVDMKYGITPNLTIDASANPDFGQVESDPSVVNLTAFETFFEERRPFFVEGASIFGVDRGSPLVADAGAPLWFYTRRIGRQPEDLGLSGGHFVAIPPATTIDVAAKLTGKTASGWSVGFLDAVTGPENADFISDDTNAKTRQAIEPLTNFAVARARRDLDGGAGGIGVLATAVDRDRSVAARRALPGGAYAGAVDFFRRWNSNAYSLRAVVGASSVTGDTTAIALTQLGSTRYLQRPDAEHLHFDPARTALTGASADVSMSKEGGATNWSLGARTLTPGFELNDLGFETRADEIVAVGYLGHRWTTPGPLFRFATVSGTGSVTSNYDGNVIDAPIGVSFFGQHANLWSEQVSLTRSAAVLDDRLTRGGPLASRPGSWRSSATVTSDGRARLSGSFTVSFRHGDDGRSSEFAPTMSLRPRDALAFQITPDVLTARLAAQYVSTVADSTATATYGARYIFAPLRERQLSVTARADWTLLPTFSIQLYAQPFAFSGRYGDFQQLMRPRSFDFSRFTPSNSTELGNPSFRLRSLNSNLVLRWDYRAGSTVFLVWNEQRGLRTAADSSIVATDLVRAAFADHPQNVFLVKVTYWFGM